MAFGQRVETAAKVPPGKQERPSSKSQDRNVSFEPSSILKKDSSFPKDDGSNLVAVSDPNEFKFDDELTEVGDSCRPDDEADAMRLIQSKQ